MYPPLANPAPPGPPPPRRRNRAGIIAAAVLSVAVVAGGLYIYVQARGSEGPSVATLRRFMDRVPLPAGAVRTQEDADGPGADNQAYLQRTYRLTTSTPGAQLRATLAARGFRVVGLHDEPEAPVTSPVWSNYAGAGSGDVYVRPPGRPTGIVELRWSGTRLDIVLSGDDLG